MSAPAAPESEPAGLLSDATLSDLQLRRQPFTELAPDDEAFADETTGEQLGDIKQALITGDDLLLVLGEAGAGKSTLLAQLGANSGLRLQCFEVRGSERFSTHNLFTGMLEAFKQAPPDELKDMLDALVPCLQGMVASNILSAIVLDNADSVTDGELTRLLSSMLYLNSQDETLLRVVLAAADSFEDRASSVLQKVVLGEADAAIVYASDAALAPDGVAVVALPVEIQPDITYVVALTPDAGEGARALVAAWLAGEADAAWLAAGLARAARVRLVTVGARPVPAMPSHRSTGASWASSLGRPASARAIGAAPRAASPNTAPVTATSDGPDTRRLVNRAYKA